jgi:hypothetical protein
VGPSLSAAVSGAPSFWRDSFVPHVAGQLVGGLIVGLAMAAMAALLALLFPSGALAVVGAVLIALYVLAETTGLRIWRPTTSRQVSSGFRRTRYYRTTAFLWGVELGTGWSTIQPTSAFLTMSVAAVVSGPLLAIAAGVVFGAARGLTLLRAVGAKDREQVERRFGAVVRHPRLASFGSAVSGTVAMSSVLLLL